MDTLRRIRKDNPHVKVLIVSADSTMNKVKEAIENGASGFVVKPLDPARVLQKIEDCFNKKDGKYIWKVERI